MIFLPDHSNPMLGPLLTAPLFVRYDGAVSQVGIINNTKILQAKGRDYSVEQLLGK
jgi:hypothetical protein